MKSTGTRAKSHEPGEGEPATVVRLVIDPVPKANPSTMKSSSALIFRLARTLPTSRPGPTPRRWIHDISQIATSAVIVCGERVSVTMPSGTLTMAWSLPAIGRKRPR